MTFPFAGVSTAPNPFDPSADAQVFKSVEEASNAIPDGHTHAIIVDGSWGQTTGKQAMVSWIQKAPDGWNIVTSFGYAQPSGLGANAMLYKSW